jgi:hypothetical protein
MTFSDRLADLRKRTAEHEARGLPVVVTVTCASCGRTDAITGPNPDHLESLFRGWKLDNEEPYHDYCLAGPRRPFRRGGSRAASATILGRRTPTRCKRPIPSIECGAMISKEKAATIEKAFCKLLECRPDELRDYLGQRVDYGPCKTGLRFVRGTHSGAFVTDSEGTDELPPGYEPPPDWNPPKGYRPYRPAARA